MRALFLFLTAILVIAYSITLRKIIRNSVTLTPLLGWWVGLGYFVVAPISMVVFLGGYQMPADFEIGQSWSQISFRDDTFLLPYLTMWLCMLAASAIIYILSPTASPIQPLNEGICENRLRRLLIITMGLAVLDWLITIRLVGGLEAFLFSHWYQRSEDLVAQMGDSFVLLSHLSSANQMIFTSGAALYAGLAIQKRKFHKGIMALSFMFLLLEVVMSGNRIYLAIFLMAVVILCMVHSRKKVVVFFLAASPLLVLVFSMWSYIRHNLGEVPEAVNGYIEADHEDHVTSSLFNVTEGTDALLMMHIMRDFGNRYDYLYGESYSRSVRSFIPRRLDPGKPANFTARMAEIYLPNVMTSLNATQLGEMYANFGPFTLLAFPFFTSGIVLLTKWQNDHQFRHGLLPALFFVVMIWTVRVTAEDSFVLFLLALCLIRVFRMEKGLRLIGRGLVHV